MVLNLWFFYKEIASLKGLFYHQILTCSDSLFISRLASQLEMNHCGFRSSPFCLKLETELFSFWYTLQCNCIVWCSVCSLLFYEVILSKLQLKLTLIKKKRPMVYIQFNLTLYDKYICYYLCLLEPSIQWPAHDQLRNSFKNAPIMGCWSWTWYHKIGRN